MKMTVVGALGAFALILGAGPVLAQTSTVIVAKPSGYLLVDPQQQVLVQRYVIAQPGTVVTLPPGYVPAVGSTMPDMVELRSFQTGVDYGGFDANGYRYVTTQEAGTLLVEPDTRRVIQIVR